MLYFGTGLHRGDGIMHYYFTAVSLIAGICLGFGILYLFIGLRRQEDKPLNLAFALFFRLC